MNLIAHEYYMITDEELMEMATLLRCFDELIENAKMELNIYDNLGRGGF